MKPYIKIFTILTSRDKWHCCVLCIAMLIGALFESVGIGLIFPLLSLMEQPDYLIKNTHFANYVGKVGIDTHLQLIMAGAMGLLVFYLFKNVYLGLLIKWQMGFSLNLQIVYAEQLYANYLLKPYLYHVNHNTAKLLRNTYDGPRYVFSNILISTLLLLTEVFTAVILGIMLLFIDVFSVIVAVGGIGVIVYGLLKILRRNIGRQGEIQNRYSGEMYQLVNQGLGAIKETKVLGCESYFSEAYNAAYEKYAIANREFNFFSQIPRFVIETLVVTGLLLLIIGKLLIGSVSSDIVPLLGVLALIAFRIMPCANRIVNYLNAIKFNMPLFTELYEDLLEIRDRLTQGDTITIIPLPKRKMSFGKRIYIDHLTFYYPEGQKKVLNDISFGIQRGDFVGIIGASGAGKTTFVDLLLGLLVPSSGDIFADGVSIYKDIRAWQANLAYVPQEIYLMDGTLRENVAIGFSSSQIDDSRVWDALRMAELYDFVKDLPGGLQTPVGERGVKLSGGQKQRIGIARALYAQPEVLVLDEATSALDDVTEKSITDTILKLKGKLTIISIAHRLTTLKKCDYTIKFVDGNVEIKTT